METCFMLIESLIYIASLDITIYLVVPCVLAFLLGKAFYLFS